VAAQSVRGATVSSSAVGSGAPGRRSPALRLLTLLLVAGLVVTLVRVLLVQTFVIPSASMEPTLEVGDRVLVSRLDYRVGDVRRGDVIVFDGAGVFEPPPAEQGSGLARLGRTVASALGAPVDERAYVKRVVGLPGERVVCCDARGRISVDGRPLTEPYVMPGDAPSDVRFDIRVPEGRLWVMGDHRSDSGDSRDHLGDPGGGTVPLDHVVGRVVSVWWPFGRAEGVGRVDATTAEEATP
jgi:signal peptidase I